MTSIRKRNGKYQVQIRIQRKNLTKTFSNLKDARKWGSHYESKIHLGNDLETLDKNIILADLINKYLKEITPTKKGWHMETIRMKRLLRQSISKRPVYLLKTKDFVEYKNERIKDGKIACRYDLTLLHHLYNVAIKQWSYPILSNPISNVPKPKPNPSRERRLSDNELKYILNEPFKNPHMKNIITIALETAMRRGEILSIKPENITEDYIYLPDSKNGFPRKVPLTKVAKQTLKVSILPFPVSPNAVRLCWNRMIKRSRIQDLHFHDLRHEAISRFFEKGLTVPEVSLISGHKDIRQLMKYTHLRIENILKKIKNFSQPNSVSF
jgi:integrase